MDLYFDHHLATFWDYVSAISELKGKIGVLLLAHLNHNIIVPFYPKMLCKLQTIRISIFNVVFYQLLVI